MKGVWKKAGVAALAGTVILANAFIPYAFATDATAPALGAELTEGQKIEEHFAVDSNILDFGRVTELERSYTKAIVVKNNTSNDVIIDATIKTYEEVAADNQKLSDWAAVVGGVTHFSVAAGATRNVSIRAAVPADAKSSTQYANVELVDANGYKTTILAKIDIAGDDLKYASEVNGADVDPIRLDEIIGGHAKVKNTGTAGFTSNYQLRIKNFFGGSDWKVLNETSKEVFPGKEASFDTSEKEGFGVFVVEQRVTFANAEGRMVESLITRVVVNLPWWSLAIAGGVIVLIILIVILAKRRKGGKKKNDKLKKEERKRHEEEIQRIEEAENQIIADDQATVEEEEEVVEELAEEPVQEIPVERPVAPAPKPRPRTDGAVPIKVNIKKIQ